jgi:hypothetical protein
MNAAAELPVAESPLLALLAESALAIERLAAGERRRNSGSMQSSRRALSAVLLPRFRELDLPALDTAQKQMDLLRGLLAEAGHGELALQSNRLLWAAIERMSTLHFDAMAQLLLMAEDDRRFDADAAWSEVQDYRARWRDDVADRADVEDEEADPVGQPPR